MKKYVALTSLLTLVACGGGGGGGGGYSPAPVNSNQHYSTPAAIRSANSAVTGMETFSSSADEIVAAVSAAGIDLNNASSLSSARVSSAHHRGASAATLASAYSATATTAQKRAMAELKNMYDIAAATPEYEPTDRQLYNAYVLSGGDANDYDPANLSDDDKTAINEAVVSRLAAIRTRLDTLVEKDGDVYQWRPITDTLEGVKFKFGSEDSYFKFTLGDDGRIISGSKWDADGVGGYAITEEGEFARSENSNTFAKTLYVWSYSAPKGDGALAELVAALETGGNVPGNDAEEIHAHATDMATHILEQLYKPIEVMDDNSELALGTVQTRLVTKITERVNRANSYGGDYDDAFADAIDFYEGKIGALTAENLPVMGLDARLNISGAKAGLKYADLGSAELIVKHGDEVLEHTFTPYVGGFDSRKADIAAEQTVIFNGTAIAGIDSKKTHGGTEVTDGMLVRDDSATLTMRGDGTAKLVMNNLTGIDSDHAGQKWNKMTVETMDPEVTHGAPKFTVEKVNGVPDDFQMKEFDNTGKIVVAFAEGDWNAGDYQHVKHTGDLERTIGGVEYDDYGIRNGGMAEFTAYGPSANNPTEATARYGFSEEVHWNSNADHEEVAIYGAFGGKK